MFDSKDGRCGAELRTGAPAPDLVRMWAVRVEGAESSIRNLKGKGEGEKLTPFEKILSSSIGGALATWNQPIEVVRVEVRETARVRPVFIY